MEADNPQFIQTATAILASLLANPAVTTEFEAVDRDRKWYVETAFTLADDLISECEETAKVAAEEGLSKS